MKLIFFFKIYMFFTLIFLNIEIHLTVLKTFSAMLKGYQIHSGKCPERYGEWLTEKLPNNFGYLLVHIMFPDVFIGYVMMKNPPALLKYSNCPTCPSKDQTFSVQISGKTKRQSYYHFKSNLK
jgi:hypothetical protein